MVQQTTIVKNKTGLHARPASQLVQLCKKFQSKVTLEANGTTVDCKSIFSLLHGCIQQDTTVNVIADGADEVQALEQVIHYIDNLEE